jgi:hypothetical protein
MEDCRVKSVLHSMKKMRRGCHEKR